MNNLNSLIIEGKITSFDEHEGVLEYTRYNADTKIDEVSTFKIVNVVKSFTDKENGWDFMRKWELPVQIRLVGRLASDTDGKAYIMAEYIDVAMLNKQKEKSDEEEDNDKDN